MSVFSTFDIAGSALSAQSLRLNLTASNLANMHDVAGNAADVYRSREAMFRAAGDPFSSALAGVDVLGVVESTAPPIERYDPGNPQANEQGIVYAANVNAMEEMANMISASRSYQSNLEVINTAKDLMLRTLTLGQG
jgi:flagellar basal-body rod protein FlgC